MTFKTLDKTLQAFRPCAVLALLIMAGCNSPDLHVSADGPAAPAPVSSAPGSVVQKPTTSSGPGTSDKVFFERVLTEGSSMDQVIAISFSSVDSQTTTPMGIALKNPVDFTPVPLLISGGSQIVYLQSNGLMSSSLVSTSLGELSTRSIYDFSNEIVAASASLGAQVVASIDAQGGVSITNLSTNTSADILAASSDPATRVLLSSSGNRVLIRTASGLLLSYASDSEGQTWKQEFSVPSVSAATLNSDGTKLVYVTNDAEVFVQAPGSTATKLGSTSSSEIFDLSWTSENTKAPALLYWARLKNGSEEIRTLSTEGAFQEQTIARINVPSSATDGVVCPKIAGGSLYFANFTGGEYKIERAPSKTGGLGNIGSSGAFTFGQPIDFAVPPAGDEGFICPSVSQGVAK
jgi:hypothetical protein